MAKSNAERGTGKPQDEEPFLLEPELPLDADEQAEARKFFQSAAWAKIVRNARLHRPPTTPALPPPPTLITAELRSQLVHERLGEIRGWKLCETAIAKQCLPKQPARPTPKDNYPDAGRVDNIQR